MKGIIICLWVAATLQTIKSDELDYKCPEKGNIILHRPYACQKFITCVDGVETIMECPILQLNPTLSLCDLPKFANCESIDPEGELPTTETTLTTDQPTETNTADPTAETTLTTGNPTEYHCPAEGMFILPHPYECEKCIRCEDGVETVQECSEPLLFNPIYGHCDLSQFVNCESIDPDAELPTTETTLTTDQPTEANTADPTAETTLTTGNPTVYRCPAEGSFILPHLYECEKFIRCEDGVETVQECSKPLLFNPIYSHCDLPEFVNCESIDPEAELLTTETTLTTDQPTEANTADPTAETTLTTGNPTEYHCPAEGIFILPHPYQCKKFIRCEDGVETVQECSKPLLFNPIYSHCDLPEFVNCESIDPEAELPTTETTLTTGNPTEYHCPAEGMFILPHPYECEKFIRCEDGVETVQECSKPLLFNPIYSHCDLPEFVNCESIDPEAELPTTETTLTTGNPTEYHCPAEGMFILPHPYECEKFIRCEDGVETVQECSKPLLFNPIYNHCDLPEFVNCESTDLEAELPTTETTLTTDQPTETNTADPTAETTLTTGNPTEYHCPAEGIFILPHPYQCEKFIRCEDGVETVQECSKPLLFNPIYSHCDLPEFVNCESIDPEAELPTTETTLTTDQPTEANTADPTAETTLPTGNPTEYHCPAEGMFILPHPYECEKFIRCEDGVETVQECSKPLLFNPIYSHCDLPEFVNCESIDLEAELPTTETTLTTDQPTEANTADPTAETTLTTGNPTEYHCPAEGIFILPHPYECEKFIRCEDGVETVQECSKPLLFNPIYSHCDLPEFVNCESIDPEAELPTTETTLTTDQPTEANTADPTAETTLPTGNPTEYHCPAEGIFILPHPYECEKFIRCEDGVETVQECSKPLLFNPIYSHCDLPEFVNCESIDPEAELLTAETTLTTDQPTEANTADPTAETTLTTGNPTEYHCPAEGIFILPHLYECEKFIRCEDGVATVHECSEPLLFNPIYDHCDHPQFVNCKSIDPESLKFKTLPI